MPKKTFKFFLELFEGATGNKCRPQCPFPRVQKLAFFVSDGPTAGLKCDAYPKKRFNAIPILTDNHPGHDPGIALACQKLCPTEFRPWTLWAEFRPNRVPPRSRVGRNGALQRSNPNTVIRNYAIQGSHPNPVGRNYALQGFTPEPYGQK